VGWARSVCAADRKERALMLWEAQITSWA